MVDPGGGERWMSGWLLRDAAALVHILVDHGRAVIQFEQIQSLLRLPFVIQNPAAGFFKLTQERPVKSESYVPY